MKKHDELVKFLVSEFCGTQPLQGCGNCPDENFWARVSDGLIDGTERNELIKHISRCPVCRKRTSDILKDIDEGILDIPETKSARSKCMRILFNPKVFTWAAGVGLVLGIALYYGLSQQRQIDYGVNLQGFLMAQADLSETGVDLLGRGVRDEIKPNIDEAVYRQTIAQLTPYLNQSTPQVDALVLATRAAISARFMTDALGYAVKWVQLAPNNPQAFNALGLAEFHKNQFASALVAFEKAIALDSKQPAFFLNAAMAADENDDTDKAIQYLKTFIALAPNHPRISQVRKWLTKLETK